MESWVAVVGLVVLLVIVFVAVMAPVISPQNPYDLNQIRIEESQLPPGEASMTTPPTQDIEVTIDPASSGPVTVAFDGDSPFVSITGEAVPNAGATSIAVSLTFDPPSTIERVARVRVDGVPRGAELSIGEKHSFRSFWEVPTEGLTQFDVTDPDGIDAPFTLEIEAVGTEGEMLMTYWLGTDGQGRDMLSAIFYGLEISLRVGVLSGVFALAIGMSLGLMAAYFGGRLDSFIMRFVDIQLSFPAILVALILLAIIGRGVGNVILALIIVQWAYYARTTRSAALVERNKEYVEAARCLALSTPRILFRHILPNCMPPLIVIGTLQVANAIALEATLSFLGIGMPLTEPSLGLLIANGFDFMLSGKYWISVFPGVALLITIIAINLVGDQLRDILNPRLRRDG
jgi:peptide/nickel transport system permease protein